MRPRSAADDLQLHVFGKFGEDKNGIVNEMNIHDITRRLNGMRRWAKPASIVHLIEPIAIDRIAFTAMDFDEAF